MQATKGIFFRPQRHVMYPKEWQKHDKGLGYVMLSRLGVHGDDRGMNNLVPSHPFILLTF